MPTEIPPDVLLKSTIRPGSVYFFPHESFEAPIPHYFIVINNHPFIDPLILLVCPSTRFFMVETRSANRPPETLVRVSPEQYSDFPYPSIIDCNYVYQESIDSLIKRLSDGKLQLKTEMDTAIVDKLRQGALLSPMTTGNVKKLLAK